MTTNGSVSLSHLEPFPHQVAGQSLVFGYDDTTICKSLTDRELRVYQTLPDVLKPFVPQYRGVVDVALNDSTLVNGEDEEETVDEKENERETGGEKEEEEEEETRGGGGGGGGPKVTQLDMKTQRILAKVAKRHGLDNVYHFLLLENLVSGYQRPCVLDLKLGTRQHGDDAPDHKVNYQVAKCRSTTSALLGVRVCGMKVYQSATRQYVHIDKTEGRRMRDNDFREAIRHFLFNGHHIRRELIPALLTKLHNMEATISQLSSFRFYSSSLLIVYDGVGPPCHCASNASLTSYQRESSSDDMECSDSLSDSEQDNCVSGDMYEKDKSDQSSSQPQLSVDKNNVRNLEVKDSRLTFSYEKTEYQEPFQNCLTGTQSTSTSLKCACQKKEKGTLNGDTINRTMTLSFQNTDCDISEKHDCGHSAVLNKRDEEKSNKDSRVDSDRCNTHNFNSDCFCIEESGDTQTSHNKPLSCSHNAGNSNSVDAGKMEKDKLECAAHTPNRATKKSESVTECKASEENCSCAHKDTTYCSTSPRNHIQMEDTGDEQMVNERTPVFENVETTVQNSDCVTETLTEIVNDIEHEGDILNGMEREGDILNGMEREVNACECGRGRVDVRMVDFAHTTHAGFSDDAVVHHGPDRGCLLGLRTLIDTFSHIYDNTH